MAHSREDRSLVVSDSIVKRVVVQSLGPHVLAPVAIRILLCNWGWCFKHLLGKYARVIATKLLYWHLVLWWISYVIHQYKVFTKNISNMEKSAFDQPPKWCQHNSLRCYHSPTAFHLPPHMPFMHVLRGLVLWVDQSHPLLTTSKS